MKFTLLGGLLLTGFLFAFGLAYADETQPYVDEACQQSFACTSDTVIWELVLLPDGVVVSFGDLDEAECEALKELADSQSATEPFTALVCRPRLVERQKI